MNVLLKFALPAILAVIFSILPSYAAGERPSGPDLQASSYLLIDFHSGIELAAKNPDVKIEPASITKLMTAYVIYDALKQGNITLKDNVLISEKAWKMEGSRMFVEAGKKVPLKRMLSGLVIQSGNDAAVALAEHIAGNEAAFVSRMNEWAKKLGMDSTHFMNTTGWPAENHYTTARDIAKLTRKLIKEFPEHYKLHAKKSYSYNGIKQYNRNKLLWRDKTVDGVKTGHTESAGYCLVASSKRNEMRLISVMLGTKSEKERADYSQELLEYGFRFFETHKLYDTGSVLAEARVWKGTKKTAPAGLMRDFYITVEKGHYEKLKGFMEIDTSLDAPIKRGDIVGKAILKDGETIISEMPLFALDAVDAGGFWSKVTDSVQKLFN